MAEAEKKVSAAQRKATDKYLEKFDQLAEKQIIRPTQKPKVNR